MRDLGKAKTIGYRPTVSLFKTTRRMKCAIFSCFELKKFNIFTTPISNPPASPTRVGLKTIAYTDMKSILISLALTLLSLTIVQAKPFSETDSLSKKDYKYLEGQVRACMKDTLRARQLAQYWLQKAGKEKNVVQQANAYKLMMHLVNKKFRMIYADSLLDKAKATKDNGIIGSAYLTVGAAHYDQKAYPKALNSYITANNYIAKTNDPYLIHKVKYTIALTKYFLGYYNEAIALLVHCMDYFREENDLAYIKSMHAIGLCYTQIGRYDLSSYYNTLGIQLANEYEITDMVAYFKNSEGINRCKQKDYRGAIQLLHASQAELEKNKDYANQITTWFYLGNCYWEIKEQKKAVAYGLKVHKGIQTKKYIRPDLRESYEMLIRYYTANNDLEKQLFFIRHLIAFDRSNDKEFKYLSYKIHKEYDSKALLEKKRKIEMELASNKKLYLIVVVALVAVLLCMLVWHLYTKKRERQKFHQIMADLAEKKKTTAAAINSPNTSLGPELSKSLLKNLEKFEVQKKYLEKDINLAKLAALLNTNTKYVSYLIANHRGKKTTTYINDLKIDYAVELLISNNKYRNYTNQALADEVGFGSTQIFTLCFKNKIGMPPTSFIQQLKRGER